MSNRKISPLATLNKGRCEGKIKVKVIRNWRGATTTGEPFKSFNVLLIDQEGSKMHAFIPGKCADQHDLDLRCGKKCIITNFDVQPYKLGEKFRPVQNDNQLVFSNTTKIKVLEDDTIIFPDDSFDFYEHNELDKLRNSTPYLLDVVGIIQNHESVELRQLVNRLQKNQFQTKFEITDRSSSVNVTLWDSMAQRFHQSLKLQSEQPVIIILTSCRCGSWNNELDLSNVGATEFYLNHNHHSVQEIRKMLAKPEFTQKIQQRHNQKNTEIHSAESINNFGHEYIKAHVILHGKITSVHETDSWFFNECTGCQKKFEFENKMFRCDNCKRRIPHPEKRFNVRVRVTDRTYDIDIELHNREVRILTGRRAEEVIKQQKPNLSFPQLLRDLKNLEITVQILIQEFNVLNKKTTYLANNICHGFYFPPENNMPESEDMQTSTAEPSTSTYHIDGMSELKFQ